ncbi:alpha/beta-hydrolase [Ascobolus immersus RN42]|uniref:Alpha/beta-hydrolase n=1 Tax=Ascobolus immersus RN42 TaxID=1160509 RepID=A0A3N4IL00_ASCIM|nr:alpha/beta-hydrolase [Ascobolus immersus RN42]
MQNFVHHHPELGELQGLVDNDGIVQLRGIPFARIPARFKHSELLTTLDGYCRDFRSWGTACPQAPGGPDSYGGYLPGEEENPVRYDEMSCLNLSITLPSLAISKTSTERLPVLVYIHGGAFCTGDAVSPVHDMIEMVRLSVRDGKPIIAVGIHYRLNFFGFVACEDLRKECEESSQPICNFGLFDQQNALLWLHMFLPGFGGDQNRITTFGESAGSMSIAYHMVGPRSGLFSRAILMSGTCATGPPLPMAAQEELYLELLKQLGIDETAEDRLEQLRNVPAANLVKLSGGFFMPLADESFFPTLPTAANTAGLLANCSWVESVIIGDCEFEGFIFYFRAQQKGWDRDAFLESLRRHYPEADCKAVMETYGLKDDMDKNLFLQKVMEFTGDLVFSQPTHTAATVFTKSGKPTYRYIYTLPNQFPCSVFYHIPHHFVDILMVKLKLQFRLAPTVQRVCEQHCRYWIEFANGLAPWEEYKVEDGKINIIDTKIGGGARWRITTREEDEKSGRRYTGWEVLERVADHAEKVLGQWITN